MRKISLLIISIVFVFGSDIVIDSSLVSGAPSDKDREEAYKDAAAATTARGGGCDTIPFSWGSSCATTYRDMKKNCDTKRSCADQSRPLADAMKRGLKPKIEEVAETCEARQKLNADCKTGREDITALFDRAKREVDREKDQFEVKLRRAKSADDITMYKNLIAYADKLLAYYEAAEAGHAEELGKVAPVAAECERLAKAARGALK